MSDLYVVDSACTFTPDYSRAMIVVESSNLDFPRAIESLSSMTSRTMAIGYASSHGISSPSINGNLVGPYPVNEAGVPLDKLTDDKGQPLSQRDPQMRPARYRVEVPVCRKML